MKNFLKNFFCRNLRPVDALTESELRKKCANGGEKPVEMRRKKVKASYKAEIERLKSEYDDLKAERERLKSELEDVKKNVLTADERRILNAVENAGGESVINMFNRKSMEGKKMKKK